MTRQRIRRELPNYALPSESLELLSSLVGREIISVHSGLIAASVEQLLEKESLQSPKEIVRHPHGGHIFLSASETPIAFGFDGLTGSIAVRLAKSSPNSPEFLSDLYKEDSYVPPFLRMRTLYRCEIPGLQNGKVQSVSIYKYPDNFFKTPIGYDLINEVGIGFNVNGSEYLVASGLGASSIPGVVLLGPNEISAERLSGLERVWSR